MSGFPFRTKKLASTSARAPGLDGFGETPTANPGSGSNTVNFTVADPIVAPKRVEVPEERDCGNIQADSAVTEVNNTEEMLSFADGKVNDLSFANDAAGAPHLRASLWVELGCGSNKPRSKLPRCIGAL
jgi:hypothetical protein